MKPILLLHGALGAAPQFKLLREALAPSRQVYTMNFSGHGGQPFRREGFGIETFAADVLQFLDDHQCAAVDIFGYSMGGYVALWLAHVHPERVNRVVTLGTKFDWSEASAAREVMKMNPQKVQEKVPAFARILEHRHAPISWQELMQRTADMMLALGKAPLLTPEILKTIPHETLIALGDQDDMADRAYTQAVAGWMPNARFMLLENTPHPLEKCALEKLLALIPD